MAMMTVNDAKYNEGRARYQRGDSLRSIVESVIQMHAAMEADPETQRNWREKEAEAHSLFLGFAEGAFGDLRAAARGRGGVRA